MSRNSKGAFSRSEEYDNWRGDCPLWLENFAAQQAAKEASETAVDAARARMAQPNIYDQMSAIISGTAPRFSSVEDAVKDYQKRTGLDQYLKRAEDEKVQKAAMQIMAADDSNDAREYLNEPPSPELKEFVNNALEVFHNAYQALVGLKDRLEVDFSGTTQMIFNDVRAQGLRGELSKVYSATSELQRTTRGFRSRLLESGQLGGIGLVDDIADCARLGVDAFGNFMYTARSAAYFPRKSREAERFYEDFRKFHAKLQEVTQKAEAVMGGGGEQLELPFGEQPAEPAAEEGMPVAAKLRALLSKTAVMRDYPGELEEIENLEKYWDQERAQERASEEARREAKFRRQRREEARGLEPKKPSKEDLSEPALFDLSQPEGPEKEELMSRYLLAPELGEDEDEEEELDFWDEAAAADSDDPEEDEDWEEEPLFDVSKEDAELRKALEELNLQDIYSPEELEGELAPEAEGDLEPEFRRVAAEKKTSESGEKEDETPELVISHPDVANFIRNLVDTSHGIQLPAIQHAILETFKRDGIAESHVDDPKLCRFINAILLDKAPSGKSDSFSNLGRGVGTQREYWDLRDSNRDPFVLLMPNKGVY